MSEQEPEFVAECLKWCNERRAEKGMEPLDRLPKGTRMDSASCPCGKACNIFVNRAYWGKDHLDAQQHGKPLPEPVMEFVQAFDTGQLPQYDEDAQP